MQMSLRTRLAANKTHRRKNSHGIARVLVALAVDSPVWKKIVRIGIKILEIMRMRGAEWDPNNAQQFLVKNCRNRANKGLSISNGAKSFFVTPPQYCWHSAVNGGKIALSWHLLQR